MMQQWGWNPKTILRKIKRENVFIVLFPLYNIPIGTKLMHEDRYITDYGSEDWLGACEYFLGGWKNFCENWHCLNI